MRIALMPSAYAPAVGGVEELSRRLAAHLVDVGHVAEVWTIRHPPELPAAEEVDGVRVRRFAMPMPAAEVKSLLRLAPAATRATSDLRAAVREFSPDVLHVQCFSANGVYAAALSALMGIPLIVSLQGETVMDDQDIYQHSASLRAGLRAGLRQARVVTGCSRFVLDDAVRRFGLAERRGVVVANGVEIGEHNPEVPLELPFRRFVLGLGRVVEKKGFDLLVDSFAPLAHDHPDLGLVIGGEGAARHGLLAQARALGLSERVVLPGTLSRGQIAWAMRNAQAFVMPSRVEPFGIVALEALEAGCPAVVSALGGASEIVRDDVDGLIVDPFDTSALSVAIGRLIDDEALRSRIAAAGRTRVREFAWVSVTERYVELYEQARMSRRRSSRR